MVSIMKDFGIVSKMKRKYKATTNSKHKLPVAPNVLARQFNPKAANQAYASDITYIATGEGWLYLAVVMDLFSRKIVGWSMAEHMKKELVIEALNMTLKHRNPASGAIHHSDRGSQ